MNVTNRAARAARVALWSEPPDRWHGAPSWEIRGERFGARFVGLGAPPRDGELARRLSEDASGTTEASWLRQVHSNRALEAAPGLAGEGDALVVRRAGIAAVVATADCVPVVLVGREAGAVVHAGWRGIAAGVVAAAVEALGEPPSAAFVGPAIGPCCYEVGEEVAAAIRAASDETVVRKRPRGRPHLDLRAAVATQLAAAGVEEITLVDLCTRCHPELLASYRRDGERAGRNLALLWRAR